jgi:TRAP transporter TAXI family solute receptor
MFTPVLTGLALAAFAAPGGVWAQQIKIGSSPASSSHYGLAVALGESVKLGTGGKMTADVLQTNGSVANIKLLQRNEIAYGIAAGGIQYQAFHGVGPFEGAAYKDIRTFFLYNTTPVMIVVREDSGVKTVHDLNGRRFNAGIQGSGTEREVRAVLESVGVKPDYYSASLDDAMNAMKDNRIVGLAKSAAGLTSPDGSILDLSALIKVRVLPIPDAEKVMQSHPTLMVATVPMGVYEKQGQTAPLKVQAHASGYATSTKVSADVIYQSLKSIIANKEMQEKVFPAVKGVDYADTTIELANIPLHAGVIRLFKEMGKTIPTNLIPPEAH